MRKKRGRKEDLSLSKVATVSRVMLTRLLSDGQFDQPFKLNDGQFDQPFKLNDGAV